jgi:NADH dehydrogenase FAD-containing subunit
MTTRIVIVGAGYAGLAAARGLARRTHKATTVTLVNQRAEFVERVRLHQAAAGQDRRRLALTQLVDGRVRVLVGTVTAVDADRQHLHLDTAPFRLDFDVLVVAVGSGPSPSPIPGMDGIAHTVARPDAADRLRAALDQLPQGAIVNVVGGGLTGIELAAELAESRSHLDVRLLTTGSLGHWLSPRARAHLGAGMEGVGVKVYDHTHVTRVEDGVIHTATGRRVTSDLTVWAGGFTVPPLATEAGVAVDHTGRVIVDDQLRSVSHPNIFAVGDAAARSRRGVAGRMSCQTALPMGAMVARVIATDLRGTSVTAPRSRYFWTNISIGRHDAVTQFTRADDTSLPVVLTGTAAARFKEFITRSTVFALGGGIRSIASEPRGAG